MLSTSLQNHSTQSRTIDHPKILRLSNDLVWIKLIEDAISENRCALYLQEVVSLKEPNFRRYSSVSLQLFDRQNRLIPSSVFLPIAEHYYLLPKLDRWVVDHLFKQFSQTHPKALEDCCFAINLSSHSLNYSDLVSSIHQNLEQLAIPPELICFEITENVALSNLEKTSDLITFLQSLGYYFTLEDFGKGLISLSYLKHLPVDYLKIPGVFVENMFNDPTDRVIVEMISYVGQKMGLHTIAENVESEEILRELKVIGVDYAQGHYLSEPKPIQDVLYTQIKN